jgi:hypothetical protein
MTRPSSTHTDAVPAARTDAAPSAPTEAGAGARVVASFERYEEAEQAVERLAELGFPVDRVTIVGHGVKLVERITGRVTMGQAALQGALAGAVTGALIGWLFGVFNWFQPIVHTLWLTVDGLWFGGLAGALIALLAHAATRGRRDFASTRGLQADRYDLVVDEGVAREAARLLGAEAQT